MESSQDLQLHFAIEQVIMDMIDSGMPRQAVMFQMQNPDARIVKRIQCYIEMWNAVKAQVDSQK